MKYFRFSAIANRGLKPIFFILSRLCYHVTLGTTCTRMISRGKYLPYRISLGMVSRNCSFSLLPTFILFKLSQVERGNYIVHFVHIDSISIWLAIKYFCCINNQAKVMSGKLRIFIQIHIFTNVIEETKIE